MKFFPVDGVNTPGNVLKGFAIFELREFRVDGFILYDDIDTLIRDEDRDKYQHNF
jgi:hypothetical protein